MRSKPKRPVSTWPWFFRLPVGILVMLPILLVYTLCRAILAACGEAILAFFGRFEWIEVYRLTVALIVGEKPRIPLSKIEFDS